jgi:DNA-binding NtrC family response regulator
MKMLVVDDEQLVRWFLERALRKSGYEVSTAPTILEASEKLDREKFDMLFVDLRMPEEVAQSCLRKWTLTVKPKVVVCSGLYYLCTGRRIRE